MAQTLKEYLDEKLKSDSLRAPDRNPLVAPQADLAKKVKALLNKYETKKLAADKYPDSPWNRYGAGHSIGDLLFGQSPELLDDMSYGLNPLTKNHTGRLPIPDKRMLDMPIPTPSAGMAGVIKNKGGNWLTGSVENALKRLKHNAGMVGITPQEYRRDVLNGKMNLTPEERNEAISRLSGDLAEPLAINDWIDNTLTKYVKNRMATPDDEVRKLADQGILHYEPDLTARTFNDANRSELGFPPEGLAISTLGKRWEKESDWFAVPEKADEYIHEFTGDPNIFDEKLLSENPWLTKLPSNTPVHSLDEAAPRYLGIPHLIDELLNATNPESGLPMNLRMKPEGFKGLSMEEAVKKVHGINKFRAEQAKKVNERFAQAEGIPVYKDYGDGTRLLEYRTPDDIEPIRKQFKIKKGETGYEISHPELREPKYAGDEKELDDFLKNYMVGKWLKQEGDTMGHCVGGYCDAVTSGQSRILSLRDKEGKSRATIELRPRTDSASGKDITAAINYARERGYVIPEGGPAFEKVDYEKAMQGRPKFDIVQIKGPGNRAPDPDVLPYLQDFVKSGDWSDVSDLQNTGLRDVLKPSGRTQSDNDELLNIIGSRFATDDQINEGMEQLRKLRIKKMFDEQE